MYSNDEIMQLIYLVVEVADPDRIILFGSYAYGEPDDKSDIDLLVIKNGKEYSMDEEAKLETRIYYKKKEQGLKIRNDLLFATESQARAIADRGGADNDALEKGIVLYERQHQ